MKPRVTAGVSIICIAVVTVLIASRYIPRQLVFVGDTQSRVYEMLGSPNIEFPEKGTLVQWYAGYEVILSNDVVICVTMKPVDSEEEKQEKKLRAELAEQRLRQSYRAVANKENLSYRAWLKREESRLQEEREKRAAIDAYEKRKLEREKQVMRTCR